MHWKTWRKACGNPILPANTGVGGMAYLSASTQPSHIQQRGASTPAARGTIVARGGRGCDNRRGLHKAVLLSTITVLLVLYSTRSLCLSFVAFLCRPLCLVAFFLSCLFPQLPFLFLYFFPSFCLLYFTFPPQISRPMFCRACLCYCSYIDG